MKIITKLLVASVVALLSTIATAADNANCDNLKISFTNIVDDKFKVNAKWTIPAVFPKPSEDVKVGDGMYIGQNEKSDFEINCPNASFKYDGDVFEAKGDTLNDALSYLEKDFNNSTRVNFFYHQWYLYPNIRMDSRINQYGFDLLGLKLVRGFNTLKEGEMVSEHMTGINKGTVIGYKVDGGALNPMLYEHKVGEFEDAFKKANTIDIFHTNPDAGSKGEQIQRIHIDKPNGIIKIYRNYEFPNS